MRTLTLCLALVACGGAPPQDPASTPDGKLCSRAYSSTIDTLTDAFKEHGVPLPTMPARELYVEKCLAQSFGQDQLKCLDPKIAAVDTSCAATLEPVKTQKEELSKLFADALDKAGKEPAPTGSAGEGAAADPADAVKDALGE